MDSARDLRPAAAFLLALSVPVAAAAAYALLRFTPADRLLTWLLVALVFAPVVLPVIVLVIAAHRRHAAPLRPALITMLLLAAPAAIACGNGRFDAAPASDHAAVIIAKHQQPGRFGRRCTLRLAPWGQGVIGPNRVDMAICPAIHAQLAPGDQLIITTRRGALGIPWISALTPGPRGDHTATAPTP